MSTVQTRRKFLKTTLLGGATLGVVACGGTALFSAATQPKIDFPTLSLGDTTMSKRILIAYASKAGSTADTAARMGETLAKRGLAVDVLPAKKAADVAAYDAVILGSGIMVGKPQPDALKFVEANKAALQGKPFHAFYQCMTLETDTPENRKLAETYKDAVRAVVAPKSDAVFAGAMDPSKLGFLEKMIMKAMKSPIGDFRRWDEINAWVDGLSFN